MKRKGFKLILIICIMSALCVSAFAASAQVSSGGYVTAFFEKTIPTRVYVDQDASGWNSTNGTMRWVLSPSSGGVSCDVAYLEGDEEAYLSPAYSNQSCMLRGYNDESFKLAVVYYYSIS